MPLIPCPECKKAISDSAVSCPSCGHPLRAVASEPQFEAYRKRVLTGSLILCLIGLPVGLSLGLPYVWGLSLAGIAVAGGRLLAVRKAR